MNNECIICMKKDNLTHYPNILTNCNCKYTIHKICIIKWNNNENCLICKRSFKNKLYNKIIEYSIKTIILIVFVYFYIVVHPFNQPFNRHN